MQASTWQNSPQGHHSTLPSDQCNCTGEARVSPRGHDSTLLAGPLNSHKGLFNDVGVLPPLSPVSAKQQRIASGTPPCLRSRTMQLVSVP